MNLLILCCYSGRDVADTKCFPVRKGLEVVQYVFTRTDRHLQIALFLEMVVGVEKGMPDKRCPNHRRGALGKVKATRLVIKMVAPARSRITWGLILHQPRQREIRFVSPNRSEEHTSELQSPDHLVCR